jgi:hypothetical protein
MRMLELDLAKFSKLIVAVFPLCDLGLDLRFEIGQRVGTMRRHRIW